MKIRVLSVDLVDKSAGIEVGSEHEVVGTHDGLLNGELLYIVKSDDEAGFHPLSESQVEIID